MVESEEREEGVIIVESDIINEITRDDEYLPDIGDENDDDNGNDDPSDDTASSTDKFEGVSLADDSVHVFRGHTKSLFAVACSPIDATLVATGGRDDRALLWRIGQGDQSKELRGHTDTVSSLAFSSDGQLLASGGLDASVNICDTSGNIQCSLIGGSMEGSEFEWVRWCPNRHLVLAGCTDMNAYLWNADKHALLNVLCSYGNGLTYGDFTPDGQNICTGSDDGTLTTWNTESDESILLVSGYRSSAITCLTLTLDSTRALTGAQDGSLWVSNITTGEVYTSEFLHSASVQCNGVSPSLPWVATGGEDHNLVIWGLQHSASPSVCDNEAEVSCLTWLGESSMVASGCRNGEIMIWDTRLPVPAITFSGHSKGIQALSVSADHNFLVAASNDGTARVFDISKFR